MKKLIILFIAALLPVVATAADTGSGSPPLTKKEQRRTLRGYKHRKRQPAADKEGATPHPPRLQGFRGTRYGSDFPQLWHSCRA